MPRMGDDRFRWRRQGGGFMGAGFDEVFHPDAKAARQIVEAETALPAPAPTPGDPPFDPEHGRITIMLPRDESGTDRGRADQHRTDQH